MAPKNKIFDEHIESELICDTDSDEYVEDLESDETEDDDNEDDKQLLPVIQKQQVMKWGLRSKANQMHVHQFTGSDIGKKKSEAPHINKDLSPLCVFVLCFASIIDLLLVTETNRHYHQYLDRRYKTPNPWSDILKPEMFLFLAIMVQMGHDVHD
jgi:hypothetical protein